MSWYFGVAYFFGGAFLANAIPHLISGVSGKSLQTPFASPPFKGLSPPAVNVAWGLFNLALAYTLLLGIGEFEIRDRLHAGLCFLGFCSMAFQCARSFGRLRNE